MALNILDHIEAHIRGLLNEWADNEIEIKELSKQASAYKPEDIPKDLKLSLHLAEQVHKVLVSLISKQMDLRNKLAKEETNNA